MPQARKVCSRANCSKLQPCPDHARKPWSHAIASRQARGYDAEYTRNRAIVLREETHCGICGGPGLPNDTVDHKRSLADGGGNERANLRRAHKDCNEARGRARGH